jgi:hypothetical protein
VFPESIMLVAKDAVSFCVLLTACYLGFIHLGGTRVSPCLTW